MSDLTIEGPRLRRVAIAGLVLAVAGLSRALSPKLVLIMAAPLQQYLTKQEPLLQHRHP